MVLTYLKKNPDKPNFFHQGFILNTALSLASRLFPDAFPTDESTKPLPCVLKEYINFILPIKSFCVAVYRKTLPTFDINMIPDTALRENLRLKYIHRFNPIWNFVTKPIADDTSKPIKEKQAMSDKRPRGSHNDNDTDYYDANDTEEGYDDDNIDDDEDIIELNAQNHAKKSAAQNLDHRLVLFADDQNAITKPLSTSSQRTSQIKTPIHTSKKRHSHNENP